MVVRVHKDCGGTIKKGKCQKCGEKFGKVRRMFRMGITSPQSRSEEFDPEEYRMRIRQGRDIPYGGKTRERRKKK